MFPIFQYEQFVKEIKSNKLYKNIFGILIVDYRQQACKEYILNYLNRFNKLSGKNINFYLPGYIEKNYFSDSMNIKINNKKYYFVPEVYEEFIENLSYDFQIDYPYGPMLILVEYKKGNFKYAKREIIKLQSNKYSIEQTGELFERIFNIVEKEYDFNRINQENK